MNKSNSSKVQKISEEISERQAYALGVIRALTAGSDHPSPTLAEVARCLDVKKQTVSQLLVILERKGYITRAEGFRSIRLTDKPLPYSTQKGRAA